MYIKIHQDTSRYIKIHFCICNFGYTCILLECNRAFKIHLRYIRIHSRYVYPTGYMQDTCRIHQNTSRYVSDRKLHPKTIGNPPAPAGTHHLSFSLSCPLNSSRDQLQPRINRNPLGSRGLSCRVGRACRRVVNGVVWRGCAVVRASPSVSSELVRSEVRLCLSRVSGSPRCFNRYCRNPM